MQQGDQAGPGQLSGEQREKIRAHLARILESPHFAHSYRSRSFLKYVVEECLEGRSFQIKERNIAIDVFGKGEDFDPQEESIVRVGAGDVRRRLSQTYPSNYNDGIQIELPVGSYCPRFNIEASSSAPSGAATSNPPLPDYASSNSILPEEMAELSERSLKQTAFLHPKGSFLTFASLCLLVIAAGSFFFFQREKPIDRIWNSFKDPQHPTLLVLPTPQVQTVKTLEAPDLSETSHPASYEISTPQTGDYTGIGASIAAARVAEQLSKRNQPFTLRLGKDTAYVDIQNGPVVLFGAFSCEIGMQLVSSLRFRPVEGKEMNQIVDTEDPAHRFWSAPSKPLLKSKHDGYSLITMLHQPYSPYPLLIIAGLTPADTQAASLFITSDDALKSFSQMSKSDWRKKNFQIVLHQSIYSGSPDKSSVVAATSW